MTAAGASAGARLGAVDDALLFRLGLHDDDRGDTLAAIAAVRHDPAALHRVAAMADLLREGLGRLPLDVSAFEAAGADPGAFGVGVLPLLALLAAACDVRAFHRSLGVTDEVSDATLADLGRQLWVHRRTFGGFGLHTYSWLGWVYSGLLYRLGRLQFDIDEFEGRPVLSTHIPEDGPLDPSAVQRSFAAADRFFAAPPLGRRFPAHAAADFFCSSWLLDPQLATALDPGSNIARFQRLWTLHGGAEPGDEDALFFVFRRRGVVDRRGLPRDTSLQRAILDRLDAGGHWFLRQGLIPRGSAPAP